MSSMTGLADEIGIAKPTFCAGCDPVPDATAVLMPITHPFESTSGPPELPGLMAASVCRTVSIAVPISLPGRGGPEMIPRVTLSPPSSASALPIATTSSPTCTLFESSVHTTGRLLASTLRTAPSALGSAPTTRASRVRPSLSWSLALCAVPTTWPFVTR